MRLRAPLQSSLRSAVARPNRRPPCAAEGSKARETIGGRRARGQRKTRRRAEGAAPPVAPLGPRGPAAPTCGPRAAPDRQQAGSLRIPGRGGCSPGAWRRCLGVGGGLKRREGGGPELRRGRHISRNRPPRVAMVAGGLARRMVDASKQTRDRLHTAVRPKRVDLQDVCAVLRTVGLFGAGIPYINAIPTWEGCCHRAPRRASAGGVVAWERRQVRSEGRPEHRSEVGAQGSNLDEHWRDRRRSSRGSRC